MVGTDIPVNYISCSVDPSGVYLMVVIGFVVTVYCPSQVVDLAELIGVKRKIMLYQAL